MNILHRFITKFSSASETSHTAEELKKEFNDLCIQQIGPWHEIAVNVIEITKEKPTYVTDETFYAYLRTSNRLYLNDIIEASSSKEGTVKCKRIVTLHFPTDHIQQGPKQWVAEQELLPHYFDAIKNDYEQEYKKSLNSILSSFKPEH